MLPWSGSTLLPESRRTLPLKETQLKNEAFDDKEGQRALVLSLSFEEKISLVAPNATASFGLILSSCLSAAV